MTVPPIDAAQADRFLELLGKPSAAARLRSFPHRDNPRKAAIGPRKGAYDLPTASRWQQEGRGVYLVINDGGDTDDAITACRAFFLEWDDKPVPWQLNAWHHFGLGEPTISITTGGKSAHLYWVISEPITPAQWIPIQAALIEATGADTTNRNPSRVMRLPGASYIDDSGQAVGQTVIYSATGTRYSLAQVAEWVEPDEWADPPQAPPQASRPRIELPDPQGTGELPPRPPETLREALERIPPFRHGAGQYDQLMKLAMRLHVDLGADDAQQLLSETCCQDIRDLSAYFQGTPTKISPGSTWPFLRDAWGIDISRQDLRGKRPPPPPRGAPGGAEGEPAAGAAQQPAEPEEVPRDVQIQALLDQLLDLHLDPTDPWAKQQATRAELWNLGVRGDAIDDRMMYALAERWGLPLKTGHTGARRGRSLADPLDSPAEDLLPGFLLWRRDHVLFGPGGSGKTLAAAAMAVSIIKRRPFLDQGIPPERSGRVLWIGTDGGEGARAMVAEYLEDLGVADDVDVIDGITIWTAEGADKLPAWCCTPRGLLELREELDAGDYALVVIDSLKAVLELAGINFGIGPVGTLMRFLQALVGRHCSLLWLHHPAGGKAAGKGLQAAAGNQNINQIPSGVHQINRVITERGPVNEWSVHKLRGSTSREFAYRLTEDGFEVTQGEITGNARSAIVDCIGLRLEQGIPTQTHLVISELFGVNESTVRNNLTWLRKRGFLRKQGTSWQLTARGQKAYGLIQQGIQDPWI